MILWVMDQFDDDILITLLKYKLTAALPAPAATRLLYEMDHVEELMLILPKDSVNAFAGKNVIVIVADM